MSIDRSEVNRALAKAIAYKNCGKDREANEWAIRLVELLECSDILWPASDAMVRFNKIEDVIGGTQLNASAATSR